MGKVKSAIVAARKVRLSAASVGFLRQALGNCSMRRLPTVGALGEAPTVGVPSCIHAVEDERLVLIPFVMSHCMSNGRTMNGISVH
ncbi:hypothetical protein [Methyloglobulus sp.]|uniref:hypothetical protein n=1 Tax=Methyloglobulus sp. TaxID=2518622 RepID=UPI0032B74352